MTVFNLILKRSFLMQILEILIKSTIFNLKQFYNCVPPDACLDTSFYKFTNGMGVWL